MLVSSASCTFFPFSFSYTHRLLSFSIKLLHKGDYNTEDGANGKAKQHLQLLCRAVPRGSLGWQSSPQPTVHKSVCPVVELISKLDNLPWVNKKQTLANQDLQTPFYFIKNLCGKMQRLGVKGDRKTFKNSQYSVFELFF